MATMEETSSLPASAALAAEIEADVQKHGAWKTLGDLRDRLETAPPEVALAIRGFIEVLRSVIVRDLLAHPRGMQAVPRLSPDFLSNFDRFNLSAQEGYLVSLIDGRLSLQKLLLLSPFDHFTTLFVLARLQNQNAIEVPR